MKRLFVIVALFVWLFTFMVSKNNYIKTIENHRRDLPSNVNIEQNVHSFEGHIISYDVDKSALIFQTLSPVTNKKIQYRLLYKNQPDLMIEIGNHNYHYVFKVDLNQNIFRSPKNSYGFDYDFYLFSQGIHGQFYILDFNLVDVHHSCMHCSRLELREVITQNINERYSLEVGSFLKAILLGNKADLINYEQYKDMGLAHIFAISGLHFGLIYKLLQKIMRFPHRGIKSLFILIVLIAFSIWVGPSYSSYRAFALIMYLEVARLLHRNPDIMTAIAFSSLLILIIRPVAILSQSFQLSFYAYFCVAVIYKAYFGKKRHSKATTILQSIKFSIVLQILLLPASLYYFHQINGYGFIANFFIVPLIGLILPIALIDLLLTIIHFQLLDRFLSYILSFLVEWMEKIIDFLPSIIYRPEWFQPEDYGLLICIFILFIVLRCFHFNKNSYRIVLISGITTIVVIGLYNSLPQKRLEIQFVDVGHGDFSILKYKDRVILIDTGDGYLDCADYLNDQGVVGVDAIILSHAHQDHIGGIEKLVAYYNIEHIYVNKETSDVLKSNESISDMKLTLIDKSNKIYWNHILLDIMPVESKIETNDNALVVRLECHDKIGYFLGDISEETFDLIKFSDGADFVKVPHHGSKTSYNASFYSDHSISSAIISHNTKYNMPNSDVIDLLESNNIAVYSTYLNGNIQLNITKDALTLGSYLNDN